MDFETLKKYKPHIPFQIIEKDLNLDPQLRRKMFFTDEDAKIKHSNELLKKGQIEMPVFKESIIRPIGFNGKILSYEIENKGAGFYIITQKRGQIIPKPNDHQHAHEQVDKFTFYIAYDPEEKTYKYLESEKTFLKLYKEIEELKNGVEVQNLINDFIDWIQSFWTKKYKEAHHFGSVTSDQTFQDFMDVAEDIENNLPTIESYHLLLNIFGDISDLSYSYIQKNINSIKTIASNIKEYLNENQPNLNEKSNTSGTTKADALSALESFIENRVHGRYYYVDKETNTAHPSIGELYYGKQLSTAFESDSSKKERLQQLLEDNLSKETFAYTIE